MNSDIHLLPFNESAYTNITLLENIFYSIVGIVSGVACGWLLYLIVRSFTPVRPRWGAPLLAVTIGISSVMIIWVGDPNLLYTFPFYFAGFMLATRGDRIGRLALCFIFFCLSMSIAAMLDTYLGYGFSDRSTDLATRLGRLLIVAIIYLGFRRFLPREYPRLSRNLWALVLALSLMPLCALASTVLLSAPRWYSDAAFYFAMRLGVAILPFVLATSLVLLGAILVLARQQSLEEAQHLASLRESYYQNLRDQEQGLRQLRHDMRNHLNIMHGFFDIGKPEAAHAYLEELSEDRSLRPTRRYCDNDAANIVLAAKEQALADAGIAASFDVRLPAELPFADADLCALFGNALDNAREAATGLDGATVNLRCRFDKGLFMLSIDNPTRGPVDQRLRTTKPDKIAHGFGLPSMKSIAARYNGTLETNTQNDRFHLLVCLSAPQAKQ